MARKRWPIVVVAILAAALVAYGILYLNRGRTASEALPDHAGGVAYVDEAVVYDELGQMTKAADLIVRGKVSGATPGATHTYAPDAGPSETDRVLSIQVIDVIKSEVGDPGDAVRIVEGWWSEGVGFAIEGMPWATAGQEGIFYLARDDSGGYAYVGSPGRVLLARDRAVVSGGHDGDNPWDATVGGVAQPWPLSIAEDGGVDRRAALEQIYRAAGQPVPTTERAE